MIFKTHRILIIFLTLFISIDLYADDNLEPPVHAMSLGDVPAYEADFRSFNYTSDNAVKGGELRKHALGTFDNFNPFTMKGKPSAAFYLTDDSLCVRSADEPYTVYGLIAESMQLAKDRSRIVFNIHPDASFHDGSSITAHDVVFSFETLINNFGNTIRIFFRHVESVKALDDRRVEFRFSADAPREMPLIVSSLQVYPEKWWGKRDTDSTTLEIPLGSGPYRIASFEQGRNIVYERVKDYWAKDLPVRKNLYNFDRIRYEYFMDSAVAMEAFKAGLYDIHEITSSKNIKAINKMPDISVVKIPHLKPQGIEGFFFNIRRKPFDNPDVRKALLLAFDWDWINTHYLNSQYVQCSSFFTNSDLSAFPNTELKDNGKYSGSPYSRQKLINASRLLEKAGWSVEKGRLVDDKGIPFTFRILTNSTHKQRLAQPWINSLKQLGITATVQLVDSSQFINRLKNYRYDVVASGHGQRLWPGMEISFSWHSKYTQPDSGGRNLIGLSDPEADRLIEAVISSQSRNELRKYAQELDRLLMSGNYVVPLGVSTDYKIAFRDCIAFPESSACYEISEESWWFKGADDELFAEPFIGSASETETEPHIAADTEADSEPGKGDF